MKKIVLVTGATGFIGRHTVDALITGGWRVRALCRNPEPELALAGADVVRGDVLMPSTIEAALEGVDAVVHGAGLVSRSQDDAAQMMRLHVNGTRNVVGLAVKSGVKRIVHLSMSGTVAVGDDPDMVYREDDPVPFEHLARFPYYLSKWLAERCAGDLTDGSRTALVTLNPSLALGPGDIRGSSTEDVRRFLKRELPIVPSGGLSFVDARDVAAMVGSALEQGRAGERYLLGALNLTFAQFFARLEQTSGVKGPPLSFTMPKKVGVFGISFLEAAANLIGAKLPVSSTEAAMAASYWYVDARKAERELGFQPRDPMTTLLDTVKDVRGLTKKEKVVAAADRPSASA